MKQSTSFRLSDEAANALKALAERYSVSQTEVIEHLILDRYLASDQKRNAQRRREAWERAKVMSNTNAQFFLAGFRAGWLGFQTRHGVDDLIEPAEEELAIDNLTPDDAPAAAQEDGRAR